MCNSCTLHILAEIYWVSHICFPRNQRPILAGEQHGVVSLLESLFKCQILGWQLTLVMLVTH